MSIDLNIQVSLSRETLDVLRQFTPDMPDPFCNCPAQQEDLKTTVENYVVDFLERLQKHAKKPVDEPKPEVAQSTARKENAPVAEEEPAKQPEQEAAPEVKEISDAELRECVKAAKDRTSAKEVRAVFAQFGITSSIECPQGRRSELVAALENVK